MPGLAHADHHHAALAGQDHLAGADKIGVDVGQQTFYCLDFEANGALCGLDQVAGLAHVGNRLPDEKAGIIAALMESLTRDRYPGAYR
ncbi:hypothetical protein D3C85_1462330 [compost metagenome]